MIENGVRDRSAMETSLFDLLFDSFYLFDLLRYLTSCMLRVKIDE